MSDIHYKLNGEVSFEGFLTEAQALEAAAQDISFEKINGDVEVALGHYEYWAYEIDGIELVDKIIKDIGDKFFLGAATENDRKDLGRLLTQIVNMWISQFTYEMPQKFIEDKRYIYRKDEQLFEEING